MWKAVPIACLLVLALPRTYGSAQAPAPSSMPAGLPPLGPLPTPRQLAWHAMEFNAFIHFGINTFTDREWGDGAESERLFNPSQLDCRQWARVCRDAGCKGIILTAKHHDGFCLWPSKLTKHSVANSPWKDGRGDVVRELSDACRAYGLKFGVYLSPWDRNCPLYGDSPRYNDYYVAQLTELLTGYGDLFEVWFDGACGEGAGGRKQVYDWPRFRETVRRLQPNAVMFSDAGPDVRWVGNENGFAGETCWGMLSNEKLAPGMLGIELLLNAGQINGTHWIPAECDVSIRPGWFHHPAEDGRVKSVEQLMRIHERSVGRGCTLLLNVPIDRRGLIHEADAARLIEFRRAREAAFAGDLTRGQRASASSVRHKAARFTPDQANDGDETTYWAAEEQDARPWLRIALPVAQRVARVVLAEPIALGQRVESFILEGRMHEARANAGQWRMLAEGTTIGRKRILSFAPMEVDALRLTFRASRAAPAISTFAAYAASLP